LAEEGVPAEALAEEGLPAEALAKAGQCIWWNSLSHRGANPPGEPSSGVSKDQ
jgi:hypothetical protein